MLSHQIRKLHSSPRIYMLSRLVAVWEDEISPSQYDGLFPPNLPELGAGWVAQAGLRHDLRVLSVLDRPPQLPIQLNGVLPIKGL